MLTKESRCCATVFEGLRRYGCSRRATVEENGRLYCRQHSPSAVEARRQHWNGVYDARGRVAATLAARDSAIRSARTAVIRAATDAAHQRGSWDDVCAAVAALEKLEGTASGS